MNENWFWSNIKVQHGIRNRLCRNCFRVINWKNTCGKFCYCFVSFCIHVCVYIYRITCIVIISAGMGGAYFYIFSFSGIKNIFNKSRFTIFIWAASREKKGPSGFPSNQSVSAHAWFLNKVTYLDLRLWFYPWSTACLTRANNLGCQMRSLAWTSAVHIFMLLCLFYMTFFVCVFSVFFLFFLCVFFMSSSSHHVIAISFSAKSWSYKY